MSVAYHKTALSMRLREEIEELMPPFLALGFDQHAIDKKQEPEVCCMGDLKRIEHLCKYGRPIA
jgi:hypothetical protein